MRRVVTLFITLFLVAHLGVGQTTLSDVVMSGGAGFGGASVGSPPAIAFYNTDDVTSIGYLTGNWKPVCIEPSCNPGGSGVPYATSQTFNVSSPSIDGNTMQLSLTASANSTNALWSFLAGSCDLCTHVTSTFHIYIGSNGAAASSYEYDPYVFDKTENIYAMWGSQCYKGGYWEIANDVSSWVNTAVPCSLSYSTWHLITWSLSRVIGDVSCGGFPALKYNTLTIDGTVYVVNMSVCATALPSNYISNSGHQFQIDIPTASSGTHQTVIEYVDESSFVASY